jgi:hypothetical protein
LAALDPEAFYKNMWMDRRGEIARDKHEAFIRELIASNLIEGV